MDFSLVAHLMGKEFFAATIFEPGYLIGFKQSEVKNIRFSIGKDEWKRERFGASFVFRGKRKRQFMAAEDWIVIEGWDHPAIEWGIPDGMGMKAKYEFGSEKWYTLLGDYLRSLGENCRLIFDGRRAHGFMPTLIPVVPRMGKSKNDLIHSASPNSATVLPHQHAATGTFSEGEMQQVLSNDYERNPQARRECLDHYGYICQACGLDMQSIYGELGRDFIHVHHKIPLSEIGREYQVDAIRDLVPVCPNCHAMLHRHPHVITIEELRTILEGQRMVPDASSNA